jgi:hypothetical protein
MQVPDFSHNHVDIVRAALDAIRSKLPSPELGGKVLAGAYLVQGLLSTLCTKQQCRLYGWSDTKLSYLLMQEVGSVMLATGIAAVALQFYESSVQTALGHSGLAFLIMFVKWYLTDSFVKAGSTNTKLIVPVLTALLVVYETFVQSSWVGIVTLGVSVFYTIWALGGILDPEQFGTKMWGLEVTVDKKAAYEATHFNVFFLVYHLQNIMLLQGVSPHNAVGFASLVGSFFLLDGYVGSQGIVKILEKNVTSAYTLCLLVFSLSCTEILLQGQ